MESIVEKPRYKSHDLHLKEHVFDHSDLAVMRSCEERNVEVCWGGKRVAAGLV
jgi:hypothetical protein